MGEGEMGEGEMGGGGSLPSFFFLREFFSRALLSERLEQAILSRLQHHKIQ